MNKENNTLIILTPGFPESEADVNCLPMQQSLIREIKKNNPALEVIVLSLQYPYFKRSYQWHDINVTSFGGHNKGGIAKLLLRRKLNKALEKINSHNKIIGLLSFWYNECAWVGKKFADKHGLKHYCWLLGQDARKGNEYVKRLKPGANELIALSDFLQGEFERNYGTRPGHMIPPGIDESLFANMPAEKDIDVVAAGSLISLKQYEIFIEVVAELKRRMPGIKAMLIGDGPEKNKLQAIINANGLQQNLALTGELLHAEVLRCMQRSKVFLHPSSYEGFGVVCTEALYAACHVISFCRPMKQDIEQWHIVQHKEEMIQKAVALLQDPDPVYKPIVPFTINDTVKKMMSLFAY